MKVIDLIKTLSSATQVVLTDRADDQLLDTATVKWFKRFYQDKYHDRETYYLDMEVEAQTQDEFGRTIIKIHYGKTKKEKEVEDKKFRKEHGGKSREQVRKATTKKILSRIASAQLMFALMNGGETYY